MPRSRWVPVPDCKRHVYSRTHFLWLWLPPISTETASRIWSLSIQEISFFQALLSPVQNYCLGLEPATLTAPLLPLPSLSAFRIQATWRRVISTMMGQPISHWLFHSSEPPALK